MRDLGAAVVLCSFALALCGGACADASRAEALSFERWLEAQVWPEAEARGVSRAVFDAAFEDVTPDATLTGLGLPPPASGDRPATVGQPEFAAPERYFEPRRFEAARQLGKRKLVSWQRALAKVERTYGVPRQILVAIWGRESSFGRARLRHDAIRVLATRAFVGERRAFFHAELLAALELLEGGDVPRGRLRSSSAGALGQPQLLPSRLLRHAVDFDADGRRDVWRSVPDVLASIASYLQSHGWESGRDWGFEVEVPPSVPCTLEGPDRARPLGLWREQGIARTRGRHFPAGEIERDASLLMPAGRLGPAFLVTPNFYVLKQYNRADLYALYVGHLADRIVGAPGFAGAWRDVGALDRAGVEALQRELEAEGYDVGGVDGLIGFRTRTAIGTAQQRAGLAPTCFPEASATSARARASGHRGG